MHRYMYNLHHNKSKNETEASELWNQVRAIFRLVEHNQQNAESALVRRYQNAYQPTRLRLRTLCPLHVTQKERHPSPTLGIFERG